MVHKLPGSACDVCCIRSRSAGRAILWSGERCRLSWNDGSARVSESSAGSTEPRAVHICRPICTVKGCARPDPWSRPGRVPFAVGATPRRRHAV